MVKSLLSAEGSMKRVCRSILQELEVDKPLPSMEWVLHDNECNVQDLGDVLYRRGRHLNAALLYEHGLSAAHSPSDDATAIYKRLGSCYEHLNLTESAEYYARRALEADGSITPLLTLARHFEKAGDLDKAGDYLRMACGAYSTTHPLPSDIRLKLQAADQYVLWPWTFSTDYLEMLQALDAVVNDPKVSEETRAQIHWEMVGGARPLLGCGEELFRREGTYGDGHNYYFATPSLIPLSGGPEEDHLILVRLLNYRIDPAGRYYRDYLPIQDTSGVLRSACALYVGRSAEEGRMVRIMDGQFIRTPYRFLGTEDPRIFRLDSGEVRVFWTSWEFSLYLGEGSRIVSGVLDVNSSTLHVDHLFQSPHDRFLEKNWVVFQVPGTPLRIVYEWYPLRIGTFNDSLDVGKLELDSTVETPLTFKHIRGSSNGCFHKRELWFLVHGTSWHKGPGPVYYHRMVVLDATTLELRRYTHPFKLESESAPVEFSLGITIDGHDQLSIAYSVFDGSSVVRRIPLWKVEGLMARKIKR